MLTKNTTQIKAAVVREKGGTVGAHHALAECVEACTFLGRDDGVY